MGHTRVIYTDSTTAECENVFKQFDFSEDTRHGYYIQPDTHAVKAYLVWGRAQYYPSFHQKLRFTPRVQIHLMTRDSVESLDFYTREAVKALKTYDPMSNIQAFDADNGAEFVAMLGG